MLDYIEDETEAGRDIVYSADGRVKVLDCAL